MADWFMLNYTGAAGKYLQGTIKLDCATEGVTVRLMAQGQLAASGTSLYETSIPSGQDNVTITIPASTLPSIPVTGTHYYIVVHNNLKKGFISYGLTMNLSWQ